ncbi:MAG TPA: single-stranded-DNA-specific exonuclease RecJ [Rhabdochlamydiaceae bacterium]|nr:single-stranded-DNA-specific exonuclease RecJ [Rhabdochlamydiaceae bacterium]
MQRLAHQDTTIWVYPQIDPEKTQEIINEFNIHPVTAQVLAARGFSSLEEIHDYLYAKLPNLLDPHLFPEMDKAVERVMRALKNKETVLIYGDNDVDGITGATLLTEFLRFIGINTHYYISNRSMLNKSLLLDALEFAVKNSCSLMITVDCGITAAAEIAETVKRGVDVIVTDHHEPTDKLPHCVATLNPKLHGSSYPNRDLTGVGVAFKLAHGITNLLISNGEIPASKIDLKRYLDLVALGTIADMGSLLRENRIFVRYGLKQMRLGKRIGLAKLFSVCEVKSADITPLDIASKVAPRLNSLGRIADPNKGIELLLIRDPVAAEILAKELDLNNLERQKIERRDSDDIEKYIQKHPQIFKERALILSSNKWHPGIIPIITARIAKQYNRPTVIIAVEDGLGKGSIRTIPEFPILPILRHNSALLENFGGHDYAAGLTIKKDNIETFKTQFIDAANAKLQEQDIISKLYLDAEINFNDLTFDFMESLNLLEPFGNENPFPIFYTNATQTWPPKIVGKTHLKFYLEQKDRVLEGIAFGMADKRPMLCKKNLTLHIAFTPHVNTFLNKSSIQLQIRDFKIIKK